MESETKEQEIEEVKSSNSLRQITPLSKYLAMGLFIFLPFVGGFVGYQYAPEKVVEVEKIVEVENEMDEGVIKSEENKMYRNEEYGFFFEYPRRYSEPNNVTRFPGDFYSSTKHFEDNKSRLKFSSGDGMSFTLHGVNHDYGREGYGKPVCTNKNIEPPIDCIEKTNQVGTTYYEREVRRNYGWEKGYEFKVNDELSLILIQDGHDDRNYESLSDYQAMILDTFATSLN